MIDAAVKNRIMQVLGVLCLIFFVMALRSCSGERQQKLAREKEMSGRMDAEEKINKANQEKVSLEEKLKAKEKELEEERSALEATKKALSQEQLINQSLKEELQKVTKLKDALEEDLKDALVSGRVPKPKSTSK